VNVDMLHNHPLLAFAAVAIERFQQRGEGAGKLAGMREILTPRFSMLLGNRGTPVTIHRSIVRGDQLRHHQADDVPNGRKLAMDLLFPRSAKS
jgi:hypothetical protein